MGIRLGILLERHPLRAAKTPVRGPIGGSAGIPDSLGRKPVNTSGRTGGRLPACRVGSAVAYGSLLPSFWFNYPLPDISLFLSFEFYACRRPPAFRPHFAVRQLLTCGNVVAFRSETRGQASDWDSEMAAAGLTQWSRVDLDGGAIRIDPKDGALHEVGGRLALGPPKTAAGV